MSNDERVPVNPDPGDHANTRRRQRIAAALLAMLALAAAGWVAPQLLAFLPALIIALTAYALWELGRFGLEARRGAAELRAPELPARLQRLLDVLPDPLMILDRRGLLVSFNSEAAALFPHLRANEPLSFTIRSPDVLDALEKVLAGDASRRRVEIVELVPVDRAFEVVISALAGQDTEARDFVAVVLHDQTQARRLAAMRVDFVANASHELRTPLASLLGFIETLQGPARSDAVAREKFLAIMAQQARRMSRLIDDLLSLSRIEMNAYVQPRGSVDLAGVVGHIVETLSGLARERAVALRYDHAGAPTAMVSGDRDELLRVFENLIENAIKYGASGGRVEIDLVVRPALGTGQREAVVSVRDFGPGIPPEHLPRLTERFYRVDVAESRDKGGTGLGLAIVKHIVNRHRGRLEIESELGQGTRVGVILPARGD
jgi:two-component system phosphate regulon sensor histidine kinase PhoR